MKPQSYETTIVIPDTHFCPPLGTDRELPDARHDPNAISIVLQVIKEIQPERIIHAGDIADIPSMSHFSKNLNRMGQVLAENGKWYNTRWGQTLHQVDCFWEVVNDMCPKAEKYQLEGNHDYRVEVMLSDPFLEQFREQLALRDRSVWKELNIKYSNYDGSQKPNSQPWVEVGNTHVMHGYGAGSPAMMEKEHDNVMYGHIHRFEKSLNTDKTTREYRREAISVGCLCSLDPKFSTKGGKPNGWVHGFGVIYTMGTRTVKRWVEITEGVLIEFQGKSYYPKQLRNIDKRLGLLEL